jgi:hypothetical protein
VVHAVGIAPLKYQWQIGGINLTNGGQINGATASQLTIGNLQLTNSGTYTVIITNTAGSVTSSNAVLTVTNIPPVITLQPTNQSAIVGSTVTFAISATGTGPLSYQWQMDGTNLADGGQFVGSISNVFTISNLQPTNSGTYTVIVTNIAGSATSSNAVLTITSPNFVILAESDGNNLVMSGTGGATNGIYFVLSTSDLSTPLDLWTPIATNTFDNQGHFIFTNSMPTNSAQMFYLLKMP